MTRRSMTRQKTRDQHQGPTTCERGTLYTLGYAQPGASARLAQLMRAEQVLFLDVRLRPHSRWHHDWARSALSARYGTRYHWEPRLGNLRYRERTAAIALGSSHQDAIREAAQRSCAGCSLVLLCVCAEEGGCHRLLVAKLIQEALPMLSSPWEART
jgi:uncharacterized protein (DUF488 family)